MTCKESSLLDISYYLTVPIPCRTRGELLPDFLLCVLFCLEGKLAKSLFSVFIIIYSIYLTNCFQGLFARPCAKYQKSRKNQTTIFQDSTVQVNGCAEAHFCFRFTWVPYVLPVKFVSPIANKKTKHERKTGFRKHNHTPLPHCSLSKLYSCIYWYDVKTGFFLDVTSH